MEAHVYSLKGARDQNEDQHTVILNNTKRYEGLTHANFFAVYDGHGGKDVSKFLSKYIPSVLMDGRLKYPVSRHTLYRLCEKVQHKLREIHPRIAKNSGSTCLNVVHYKDKGEDFLTILNTGDSRCVLSRSCLALPLTLDHKPGWPKELARIKAENGHVYFDGDDHRIKDLSVSRAYGDLDAAPFVIHRPDIFRYKLRSEDQFIIVACDGLWDVMTNQDAVNFVIGYTKKENIAKKLAEHAISKGSMDNVTVIVAFLQSM
jgi:serine/threonine protein phosphatase PrpC